ASDPGVVIVFRIWITDEKGERTQVAQRKVEKHEWLPIEADLTAWAGQSIRVELVADVGESDNSSGDWACWARFAITTREPHPVTELE
ncbi:MAG: hypothetical protein Q4C47_01895, partial [Planctomycetia bacterium]|nr:hypothetical protein [Planctomycetia bacterium]